MTGLNLVVAFVIFSLLYCVQLFFNRSLLLKVIVVTYLFFISSAIYFSFETYKGWPSSEKVTKGYLVATLVVEPTKQTEGAIYAWIIEKDRPKSFIDKIFGFTYNSVSAPRSYKFEYTHKRASNFNHANKQIKEGNIVMVDGDGESGEGSSDKADKKGANGEMGDSSNDQDKNGLRFTIIPPTKYLFKQEE